MCVREAAVATHQTGVAMMRPIVKHKAFEKRIYYAEEPYGEETYMTTECGLWLARRGQRHRYRSTWPATTCKNCLRNKPKAKKHKDS